jgi:hypothetical protein
MAYWPTATIAKAHVHARLVIGPAWSWRSERIQILVQHDQLGTLAILVV